MPIKGAETRTTGQHRAPRDLKVSLEPKPPMGASGSWWLVKPEEFAETAAKQQERLSGTSSTYKWLPAEGGEV